MSTMYWIDINQYLPGRNMTEVLVRLENGDLYILEGRSITGIWLAKDGMTRTHVTHWMEIKDPQQ